MSTRRSESDLTKLRRLARDAASGRKEAPSTIHLLVAVWRAGGPARELLDARRLDEARLLQAARMFDETDEGATDQALEAARRMAQQTAVPSRAMPALRGSRPTAAPEPSGIHVLVALVSNRHCAAYRALAQCGVDIANLRSAATRVALGVVTPPRRRRPRESALPATAVPVTVMPATPRALDEVEPKRRAPKPGATKSPGSPRRRRSTRAVQVPLIPPARKPQATMPGLGEVERGSSPEPSSVVSSESSVARATSADAQPAPSSTDRPSVVGGRSSRDEPSDTPPRSRSSRRGKPARRTKAEADRPSFASRPSVPDEEGRPSDAGLEPTRSWSAVLDPERFPTLAALRNLTAAAALGELEPAIAREEVVGQALDVLAKRHANSPVLVGRAGVGKTTVAHAIAAELATEPIDRARLLLAMPAADLLAGTGARGSLAEKLTALRDEVKRADGRVILFVDELHELLDGGLDEAVGELKTALASGDLPLLGATSPEEYRRCIESDAGLARRFTVVEVPEPSESDALAMLEVVASRLEAHHGVSYTHEALVAAVSWSIRYLPGRALPDKALGVLDLAGARLKRRGDERRLDPKHVADIMAELVDVPRERLLESDQARMLRMADLLRERVVGHQEACDRIAAVLRRNAAGLRGHRPLGTFLLLGPTGVGKTETAKAVADVLFGAPDAMTRLDMSEYAEPHAVARLVGAPPGYVGHEAGGLLTESVRKRPYQVILLDEIEKAHQDVLQAFLQVFDEGRLTDGRGRT
ncbi:MAG TPA: AAA family ATPase, partial [Polyangiaceae bacterium]|nr:AAA family ATPase [Polyangiaceae bacterium]